MTLADWIKLLGLVASIAGSAVAILRNLQTRRQVSKHLHNHKRAARITGGQAANITAGTLDDSPN